MKKIAIVLGVVLMNSTSNSFYGSQLIQKEYDQEYTTSYFLDSTDNFKDEYGYTEADEHQVDQEDDQISIDEYDQHICDEAQAPKISSAEALIKKMFGYALIQYITLREMAHAYCKEVKQTLHNWFASFIEA